MGEKSVNVSAIFKNNVRLRDAYSGVKTQVVNGKVALDTDYSVVLLEMY